MGEKDVEKFALGLIVAAILFLLFRREFDRLASRVSGGDSGCGCGGGAGSEAGGAGGIGGAGGAGGNAIVTLADPCAAASPRPGNGGVLSLGTNSLASDSTGYSTGVASAPVSGSSSRIVYYPNQAQTALRGTWLG